jgi:hypothetical protein
VAGTAAVVVVEPKRFGETADVSIVRYYSVLEG